MTDPSRPIRLLIVDDDALVRAGLSMMLAEVDDLRIVGEAADGSEVLQAVRTHAPGVVLMDIRMPRMDGLAATELLRRRENPPEIIVLTTFDTDDHVLRRCVRAPVASCSRTPRRRRSYERYAWSPRASRCCPPR